MPWKQLFLIPLVVLLLAAPVAADNKVGFVDSQRAVSECAAGKAAKAELASLLRKGDGELDPLRRRIDDLQKSLQETKFLLSYEALQEQRLELVRLRRRYERESAELEESLQFEQIKLLHPIRVRLARVLEEIGREQSLSMIVDRGAAGLMYFDSARDLTALAIERLDAKARPAG